MGWGGARKEVWIVRKKACVGRGGEGGVATTNRVAFQQAARKQTPKKPLENERLSVKASGTHWEVLLASNE